MKAASFPVIPHRATGLLHWKKRCEEEGYGLKAEGIYSEFSHIRHSISTGLVIGGSGASTSDEKKPEVNAFTFSLQPHDLLLRGVPTMHEQRLSERIRAQER